MQIISVNVQTRAVINQLIQLLSTKNNLLQEKQL